MRNLAIVFGLVIIVTSFVTMAYFYGTWVPNNPLGTYPVKGIDVSHHNGEIDWHAVASDGVKFAYIKATEGSDFQDDHFAANCREATAAGIPCGAYHYFRLGTPGAAQAQNFLRTVPRDTLPLPLAVDLETSGNSSTSVSPADFRKQLDDYLAQLRQAYGTEPVIYTSSDFIKTYLGGTAPKRLWYRAVFFSPHLTGYDDWLFWQYTERGRVKGISSFVDLDVFHGKTDELLTLRTTGP
jgi:lysozyme